MSTAIDLTLPAGVTVASHAPLLYTPEFWDPRKAYIRYRPDVETAFREGVAYRKNNKLRTAAQLIELGISNAIMFTDLQDDFREGGRLGVNGTDTAVLRACVRAINGTILDHYTLAVHSQDSHPPLHLSFGSRWWAEDGLPFDLREHKAAVLDLADERRGIFKATCFGPNGPIDMGHIKSMFNADDTVKYWHHLQGTGQGPVWVFAMHCKIGTDGTNLHPLLSETLAFMEGARMLEPVPLFKGHIRDTDWFGAFQPCRPDSTHPQGGFQKTIVDLFGQVKGTSDFVGVTEDFCNYHTEQQAVRYFDNTNARLLEKLAFVTDCTAAIVPDAPHVVKFYAEAEAKGVRFITHDAKFQAAA